MNTLMKMVSAGIVANMFTTGMTVNTDVSGKKRSAAVTAMAVVYGMTMKKTTGELRLF